MASEDTGKRFFNLGTRHIAIGIISTALVTVIVMITLASVNLSKLSRIEDITSFLKKREPPCKQLTNSSTLNDAKYCFPGYFLTDDEYISITKLPKRRKPVDFKNITDHYIQGPWLIGTEEVHHGCCKSSGSFSSPLHMKDIHNTIRTLATFTGHKQHFYSVDCGKISDCTIDCKCQNQKTITTAVYVNNKNIFEVGWFYIGGCCICANT